MSIESYNSHNSILKLIDQADNLNVNKIIANLEKNQYSLKTALMMPMEEFIDRNQEKEFSISTYLEYTTEEELYGLFAVIDTKVWKLFKYIWEEKGALWNEKHLIPVINHIIEAEWEY